MPEKPRKCCVRVCRRLAVVELSETVGYMCDQHAGAWRKSNQRKLIHRVMRYFGIETKE